MPIGLLVDWGALLGTGGGAANGNSFYRARYYHPTFQRFIAQDQIGFAGGDPNLYAHVGNNPLILLDPTGQAG